METPIRITQGAKIIVVPIENKLISELEGFAKLLQRTSRLLCTFDIRFVHNSKLYSHDDLYSLCYSYESQAISGGFLYAFIYLSL